MTWKELLADLLGDRKPAFLATATNGLKTEDTLLAFNFNETTLLRNIDRTEILKNAEFHQITPEMAELKGFKSDYVFHKLDGYLRDTRSIVFTYNPAFQRKFITKLYNENALDLPDDVKLYDLPALLKFAECHLPLYEKEVKSLDSLEKAALKVVGKPPSVKQTCTMHDIVYENPPAVLPVTYAGSLLKSFWELLENEPVSVQSELPGLQD